MSIQINMRVESYDVQPNGNIKISSLLKMLQKAAGDDVNKTQLNYFTLADNNMAFVLTKMTLKFLSEICVYDELTIISHPRKTRGASFPRDFIIKRGDETVAVARSIWVLLDLEKRTILRPSAIDSIGSLASDDESDLFEIADVRFIPDDNSLSRTNVHRVEYSLLDMNNHLNNTFYADFVFNAMSHLCCDLSSNKGLYFQINYKNEARLNDEIEIFSCNNSENSYVFSAKNKTCDKICFTAYVSFGVD